MDTFPGLSPPDPILGPMHASPSPFPHAESRDPTEDRRIGAGEWSLAAFVALGLLLALLV